jgi:RND family efflux transporter MFP subunit
MRSSAKTTLPIAVLLVGSVASVGLVVGRGPVETEAPAPDPPLVRVQLAQPGTIRLQIETQGPVAPRTESDLVAEIAGRITWVSPSLASGGFLAEDESLVRIEATDYEVAVERARASVVRGESEYALAKASLQRHKRLSNEGVASDAIFENAANRARVAEATLRDSRAWLRQAEHDLSRTDIRSPFAGRVRNAHVGVGQYVTRGAAIARIYTVDYAEVRLPIPDADAAFLKLPIEYRNESSEENGKGIGNHPKVLLEARFAGGTYTWQGRIVRTEGELDPKTHMIHAVARVEDPYGRGHDPDQPPLAVGLFVNATIEGIEVDGVVALPRSALRGSDQMVVVDDEGRLRRRSVDLIRRDRDRVWVRSGLVAGERVCVTPLAIVVDGMQVTVDGEEPISPRTLARSTGS